MAICKAPLRPPSTTLIPHTIYFCGPMTAPKMLRSVPGNPRCTVVVSSATPTTGRVPEEVGWALTAMALGCWVRRGRK